MFQRQIEEVQYTIPKRHITNISDFVWFQRSYGSMKSVSFFSSIDSTYRYLSPPLTDIYAQRVLSILSYILSTDSHGWTKNAQVSYE